MIAVEWYRSVPKLIEGLMKNMFARMEYNVLLVVLATIGSLFLHIWPWIGLWATTGCAQILNGVAVVMLVGTFAYTMVPFGVKPWHGLLLPVTITLFVYILCRATILTIWQGGITWRGTFYPLVLLKADKV